MDDLFIIIDNYNNGFDIEFLDIASLLAILSGVLVITTKNPIISVLFLIGLFLCISSYLFLLGMNFIGLSYLLVYIGAVSILFLFILMLINVRVSELQAETSNSLPLASIIGICFYYIISKVVPSNDSKMGNDSKLGSDYKMGNDDLLNNIISQENEEIYYVTSKIWDGNLTENSHISSIGNVMYTNYFIWLIITSIVLLLAMVGAIIITIRPENK